MIWWPADARYYRFNMQSSDIACTGGVRSAAQVLSLIYMIYVVSFDVVAEKKGHV